MSIVTGESSTFRNQLWPRLRLQTMAGSLIGTFICVCVIVQGALSTMPAVKSFALYAAVAILLDFALQMTAFVALLSLDCRRQDSNRCELLCCIQVSRRRDNTPNEGFLLPFINKYYAPALLNQYSRMIVVKSAWHLLVRCH